MKYRVRIMRSISVICFVLLGFFIVDRYTAIQQYESLEALSKDGIIQWVDFDVPASAMQRAAEADIKNRAFDQSVDWIEILAVLGTKYGGDWSGYRAAHMDSVVLQLESGTEPEELVKGYRFYDYYYEAYSAVLGGFLGGFKRELYDETSPGGIYISDRYGIKAYSPIAKGFGYSHYDDFGNARSYGFSRQHFGNDLISSVGTPICAVESGIVEDLDWNQYGGWTVGIRSLDTKRYYYYAHLRAGTPYHIDMYEGRLVKAGEVIGYMGMTGYSRSEDVSNMTTPHLHFGIQLIFTPEQDDAPSKIWIDCYELIKFLSSYRSYVERDDENRHYYSTLEQYEPDVQEYIKEHPESRR